MTDYVSKFWLDLLLLMAGFFVASFAHEGGHAVAGALVGIEPRVVNFGVGRPWLRLRVGRTWLVARIGFLAGGWCSHTPTGDRRREALLVAGGPFGNLLLLGALAATAALRPAAYPFLEPMGFAQLAAIGLTLFPAKQKTAGQEALTDGLHLYRLLIRRRSPDLGKLYATLLRAAQPPDAPPHPLTPHAGEILYHALRADRWRESWAAHEASKAFKALLAAPDLSEAERAFVLLELLNHHLLLGGAASQAELDAWAQAASALADTPRAEAARGAALVVGGRVVEGKRRLTWALDGLTKRRERLSRGGVLAYAYLGVVATELGDWKGAIRGFTFARTFSAKLSSAMTEAVVRLEQRTAPRPGWRDTRQARLKRWLAGIDLA